MRILAPDYYPAFRCTAGACRHTCCVGWEIDVDAESAARFARMPDIAPMIQTDGTPHIRLSDGERCPFLRDDGLCRMICDHGADVLCQICRDHPRFRSFFTDRTEIGLGLVCEEAARLILSRPRPMRLLTLSDDGNREGLPDDEQALLTLRQALIDGIRSDGPLARLEEYLYFRHIPDALYDGRTDARIAFVRESTEAIRRAWAATDGSLDALIDLCRVFSYDVEYDEDALEARLAALDGAGSRK